MKRTTTIAFALLLSMALVGCAAPAKQAGSGTTAPATNAPEKTSGKGGTEILPQEGTSAESGSDKASALAVADAALTDLRVKSLGDKYAQTGETFATVNVMQLKGNFYVTYSRTLVDGRPASAYAATFVVDPKTKKVVSFNEKP